MAIADVPIQQWGSRWGISTSAGTPQNSTMTLNANGHNVGFAYIVPPQDDGKAIEKLHFRVNGVNTSGDFVAYVSNIIANANPTPGSTDHASETVNVSAGGWHTVTWSSPHTVSAGDDITVYIQRDSGSGDITVRRTSRLFNNNNTQGLISYFHNDPTVNASGSRLQMVVEHDDGTYADFLPSLCTHTHSDHQFNNTDTDKEHGNKITFPMTCRIWGVLIRADFNDADFAVHLYNSLGTPQDTGGNRLATSGTLDGFWYSSARAAYVVPFTSRVTVDAGSVYRLTVEPKTGTDVNIQGITEGISGLLTVNFADNVIHTEDDGASGWTDTSSEALFVVPMIDGLDDGAGGGGGGGISQLVNGGLVA